MTNHLGYRHIAFEVDAVVEVYHRALGYDAIPLDEITTIEVPDVGQVQFLYLRDPEGNIIALNPGANIPVGLKNAVRETINRIHQRHAQMRRS